ADGWRIQDVLARSGARLVEVGTTNRTRAADYEQAVGPQTALVLRVHQSNFRVVGFTELPAVEELAGGGRPPGVSLISARSSGWVEDVLGGPGPHVIPLIDAPGSGALTDVPDEPSVRESLQAGADLVCFSGDKLLGGPHAVILVRRADLIARRGRPP